MQAGSNNKSGGFQIYTDIYLKSTFWAFILLCIFGIIASGTIWVLFNVIRPSYENAKAKKEALASRTEKHISYTYEKEHFYQHPLDLGNFYGTWSTPLRNGVGTPNG